MGTLQYDGLVIEFEDRLLAHLQIVIVQKLRRGESFLMTWRDSAETGDGHSSIWLHPSHMLYFKFVGSRQPTLNREWLDHLAQSANSSRGLLVTRETSVGASTSSLDPGMATGRGATRPGIPPTIRPST